MSLSCIFVLAPRGRLVFSLLGGLLFSPASTALLAVCQGVFASSTSSTEFTCFSAYPDAYRDDQEISGAIPLVHAGILVLRSLDRLLAPLQVCRAYLDACCTARKCEASAQWLTERCACLSRLTQNGGRPLRLDTAGGLEVLALLPSAECAVHPRNRGT